MSYFDPPLQAEREFKKRHVQTLAATILAGRLANPEIRQPAEKDAAYSVFLAHAIIKASEEWRGE